MVDQEQPGRRARKRATRSREIVEAAMGIVVHEGLDALTMGRLADALDLAAGGLYRYFPSKDALLVALQLQAIEDLRARIAARIAAAGATPLGAVVAAARGYVGFAEEAPVRARLVDAVLSHPGHVLPDAAAAEVYGGVKPLTDLLCARLDGAVAAGSLAPGPARPRTLLLWAALHGLGHFRKLARLEPGVDPARQVDDLLRALLVGWGAAPDEVETALQGGGA